MQTSATSKLEQYALSARTGTDFDMSRRLGLRDVLPFVVRHAYILPRVVGSSPVSMIEDGRYLFYQIPFSEWRHLETDVTQLIQCARNTGTDNPKPFSYGPLDCYGNDQSAINWHSANDHLSWHPFLLEFNDTRGIHSILASWHDRNMFISGQNDLQSTLRKFLKTGREGYPPFVFDLEKILFSGCANANYSAWHYPLFRDGTWFGILVLVANTKILTADCHEQVLSVLPHVESKIFRFVYNERFVASSLVSYDNWVVDNVVRIATTMGLTIAKTDHGAFAFMRKPAGRKVTDWFKWTVFLSGGPILVKFEVEVATDPYARQKESIVRKLVDPIVRDSMQAFKRLVAQRTSATAAIMSRNMSHNLGSHALANSKFFDSVGLLNRTQNGIENCSPKDVAEARGRLQAFNQYCQGRLDFIARKLSEDGDKPEPLFLLNDVVRGFAAQQVLLDTLLDDNGFRTANIELHLHGMNVTKDAKGKSIIDNEGKSTKVKAGAIWRYAKPVAPSKHGVLETFHELGNSIPLIEDALVGITGGATGCHALFALIENLLRNAAKYSKRDWIGLSATLELHIEFMESKDARGVECYRLRMWENLTNDVPTVGKKQAVVTVREGLKADVINDQGQPIQGGHGVQEMKLCAVYLAGDLVFENDDCLPSQSDGAESEDADYIAYLKQMRGAPGTDTTNATFVELSDHRLRAYRTKKEERQALVYEMLLPKPVLLGIACVRMGENGPGYGKACKPTHPSVRRYPDLNTMGGSNAHFGLIIAHDDEPATMRHVLVDIAKYHTSLPYRLLIVTRNLAARDRWVNAVMNATADASVSRFYPATEDEDSLSTVIDAFDPELSSTPILPQRRVHVIVSPAEQEFSFFCGEQNAKHIEAISYKQWQQLILEVYEQWIRVWKSTPAGDGRWKLLIGFERDADQIEARWMEPLKTFTAASGFLDVYIAGLPKEETLCRLGLPLLDKNSERIRWTQFIRREIDFKPSEIRCARKVISASRACLVFDNHGNMFADIKAEQVRFYHKFSGGELSLFQMLESPPSEPFGFAFFMLSLLESCLTNVVTLDERVADATITEGTFTDIVAKKEVQVLVNTLDFGDKSILTCMRMAGIHPLYSFAKDEDASPTNDNDLDAWRNLVTRRFISPNLTTWIMRTLDPNKPCSAAQRAMTRTQVAQEGVRYSNNNRTYAVLPLHELVPYKETLAENGLARLEFDTAPDAIIIHEGITDSLCNQGLWKKGDHKRLYGLLPAVIRTSGRGRQSRELGDELPFIELNVLSDSCYGSLNKVKLARAILNAAGESPASNTKR